MSIPRGMFLGGCFYTAQNYEAPVHISFIQCADTDYMSRWGIADATGKELAIIYFKANSLVGDIIGLDGQYAGCLKARQYNYCNAGVTGGDLGVFLQGLSKDYTLDADTLIWDICCCSMLTNNAVNGPHIAQIILPDDCTLAQDTQGAYYMRPLVDATENDALRVLRITEAQSGGAYLNLSGTHISILPLCASAAIVSGDTVTSSSKCGASEDTLGAVLGGAVVIATHRGYPQE